MKFLKKAFGRRLKSILKKRGKNQEFLAGEMSISTPSVSAWMTGDSWPSEDKFEKICQILRCSEADFIDLSDFGAELPNETVRRQADDITDLKAQLEEKDREYSTLQAELKDLEWTKSIPPEILKALKYFNESDWPILKDHAEVVMEEVKSGARNSAV